MIHISKTMRTGIKVTLTSIALFFGLAHTSLFNHFMQKQERAAWLALMGYFTTTSTAIPPKKMAIITGADIPAIAEMVQAAVDMCEAQGMKFEIKKFFFNNDFALLKNQVEESIAWNADAILSIGSIPAQNIHTILTKREIHIPHIFACVTNPLELGITEEKYVTGTTSTGTAEDPSGITDAFVASFKHVRPDAQKVLIFHSSNTEKAQENLAKYIKSFATQKIQAATVYTETLEEVARCAQAYITRDIDAVIILRDFVVVRGLQSILKHCRINGTTAFASDSGSVRNGAVAGCCVDESELGLLLAEVILKVVHHGIPCNQVPITYFDTARLYRSHINQYEMHTQGLHNRGIYDLMNGEAKLEFLRGKHS